MKSIQELKNNLKCLHKKSYPAYKSLAGAYDFNDFILSIDHVQGDPFASPSALSIKISHKKSGIPPEYRNSSVTAEAICDFLLRKFGSECHKFSHAAKGSGKSGVISVSRPGQEILKRSACTMDSKYIYIRFYVGFPANGRTINSIELSKILLEYLPKCVNNSLLYSNLDKKSIQNTAYLAEDQNAIRKYLSQNDYIAFVADGSILPRESGTSQLPMKDAIPFTSPENMRISIELPHRGKITGIGIKAGITIIAGGGYHGKSTLLQALERGVYNHISGDGREFVITDESALKIRAEDGRIINDDDISMFINNLPNNKSTSHFSSEDASGSTSQAANIIEGIESGSSVFLIDEDTSATNFMVRDELMQKIVSKEKEPITPFLERARDLYKKTSISSIIVIGSCGSYFYIADKILQMDNYNVLDITNKVRDILKQYQYTINHQNNFKTANNFKLPDFNRKITIGSSIRTRKNYRATGIVKERLKTRCFGTDSLSVGNTEINLRHIEQIVDSEQVEMLAKIMRLIIENFSDKTVSFKEITDYIDKNIIAADFNNCSYSKYIPGNLAMPRLQEIYACLNRYKY